MTSQPNSGISKYDSNPTSRRTLFDNYLCEVTPGKSPRSRCHDYRYAEMLGRYYGQQRKVKALYGWRIAVERSETFRARSARTTDDLLQAASVLSLIHI